MEGGLAIEVLIPHYNAGETLKPTLDALAKQTVTAAVCVIDDGSTDASVSMLAGEYPQVRVVSLPQNRGFSAAVNAGARSSWAQLLILLNNDAVPDVSFVENLATAQRETNAEMVAGCLRSPDGPIESLGVQLDRSLNPYDACHGAPYDAGIAVRPLGPSGGAAAYLRESFLEVGGFDEAIFMYYEDVDLAIRMRLAGMTCASAPQAFAWHEHSASLGARSPRKNELLGFARGYLLWKYGRNLSRWESMRGVLTDGVVYAGKAAIDRNVAALEGRLRARRATRGEARPFADPRFDDLPLLRLGLRESLGRRLARRR